MKTWSWQRWVAIIGALFVVSQVIVVVTALGLGLGPSPTDEAKLADFLTKNRGTLLAVVFIEGIALTVFLIFTNGLRSVLRSDPNYEYAASLFFGAAVLTIALTGASLGLVGAAAVDAGGKANPGVLRTLDMASVVVGWMGTWPLVVLLGTAAYATARSRVIAPWTAWVGYAAGGLNLVATLTIFGGSDPNNFFAVNGAGGYVLSLLPLMVWVGCVSFALWRLPAPVARNMPAPAF